jgi:hypothetical protein
MSRSNVVQLLLHHDWRSLYCRFPFFLSVIESLLPERVQHSALVTRLEATSSNIEVGLRCDEDDECCPPCEGV